MRWCLGVGPFSNSSNKRNPSSRLAFLSFVSYSPCNCGGVCYDVVVNEKQVARRRDVFINSSCLRFKRLACYSNSNAWALSSKNFILISTIKMKKATTVGATQNSKNLRLLSYELAIVNGELELEGSKFLVLTSTYEGFKRPVESWFEFEKYDSNVLKQYAFLKMKASREFSQLPDGEKSFALYWKQGLIKVLQNKGVLSEKIRMEA